MISRLLCWLFRDEPAEDREWVIGQLYEIISEQHTQIAQLTREAHARDAYIAELVREADARAEHEPEPIVLVPQPEDDDEHRLKHYLMCGCELWPNCRHGDS